MSLVVRPCSCSSLTTLDIGAPEEGFRCNSVSFLLHTFVSLAENHCCLESKITGVGLSPDSYLCCQFLPEVFPVASSERE